MDFFFFNFCCDFDFDSVRLTERSFPSVKLHLQHTLLHGFEVTDELQERLDLNVQLGGPLFRRSIHCGLILFLKP